MLEKNEEICYNIFCYVTGIVMGQKKFERNGTMQKDAKKLISSTFVKLVSKKAFDKITIKDIVDSCEINRNTFYYHYSDIYGLLEEIFKTELNIVIERHKETGSYMDGLIEVAQKAYSHKKFIFSICSSRSFDYFEHYMYRACKPIMIEVVSSLASDLDLPDDDLDFIASFYEYACMGVVTEWFKTGMRESPEVFAGRLWFVMDNIRRAVLISAKRNTGLSE